MSRLSLFFVLFFLVSFSFTDAKLCLHASFPFFALFVLSTLFRVSFFNYIERMGDEKFLSFLQFTQHSFIHYFYLLFFYECVCYRGKYTHPIPFIMNLMTCVYKFHSHTIVSFTGNWLGSRDMQDNQSWRPYAPTNSIRATQCDTFSRRVGSNTLHCVSN